MKKSLLGWILSLAAALGATPSWAEATLQGSVVIDRENGQPAADVSNGSDRLHEQLAARDFQIDLSWTNNTPSVMFNELHYTLPLSVSIRNIDPGYEIHVAVIISHKGAIIAELRPWNRIRDKDRFATSSINIEVGQMHINGPVRYTRKMDGQLIIGFLRIVPERLRATLQVNDDRGSLSLIGIGGGKGTRRLAFSTNEVADLLKEVFGISDDAKTKGEDHDVNLYTVLTTMELGTVSTAGKQEITGQLTLTPPKLPFAYDGIMLLPLLLKRKDGGNAVIHLDQTKAPPLMIPVAGAEGAEVFDVNTPERSNPAIAPKPPAPSVDLAIEVEQGAIPRGRQVRKRFRIRHGAAKPGSEIYVALTPSIHDEGIFLGRDSQGRTVRAQFESYNIGLSACRNDLSADLMRIRQSPITVNPQLMFLPILEAGRLGTVSESKGGVVEGEIEFTAPPLADWYNTLEATPILLSWDERDGKLCAQITLEPERGGTIPLLIP